MTENNKEQKGTTVSFNAEHKQLHTELKNKKLTSQDFATFVKSGFTDKVDSIRRGALGVDNLSPAGQE